MYGFLSKLPMLFQAPPPLTPTKIYLNRDSIGKCRLSLFGELTDCCLCSLYATSLRLRIVNALRHSKDPRHKETAKNLSPNLVYSFPVIKDLAAFISSLLSFSDNVQDDLASRSAAAMEAMITKYSSGFNVPLPSSLASTQLSAIILLTGSTGNLGSQILAKLLEDSRVQKVYAHNRVATKPIMQRHIEKFENVGLDVELLKSEKLVFISGDAAEPNLGLDQDLYTLVRRDPKYSTVRLWQFDLIQ